MGTLHEELGDLVKKDSTIYHALSAQAMGGSDDRATLIYLVRQLAREKAAYLQDAIDTRNRSVVPVMMDPNRPVL